MIPSLASCLRDARQSGKIGPALEELLAPRGFAIACGYADANDAARLAADPIHKRLLGRDPVAGRDLASQPPLSRFENAIGAQELCRLGETLAASVFQRHAQRWRHRARRGSAAWLSKPRSSAATAKTQKTTRASSLPI